MTISEVFRRQSFWTRDWIQGGVARKHFQEIHAALDHPEDGSWKLTQAHQLQKLLRHAVETTRFYPSVVERSDARELRIESFPAIDKETIRANASMFVSSRFDRSSLSAHRTSGSTGMPLEILRDPNKRKRHIADVVYFGNRVGFDMAQETFLPASLEFGVQHQSLATVSEEY